ncbi:hypothetical protein BaRGS_00031824 [Batillaria attramentaria]|uniref:C1q domain-containing protein n=1 Tax=Batillaria attramentaria TaxID=370345 RepID=A0ABD0JQQ1_9CAEN
MHRQLDTRCITILLAMLALLANARVRRSDDNGPLELVVNGLSEKVTQLTAQLQAQSTQFNDELQVLGAKLSAQNKTLASQEAEITSLKNQLASVAESVAFTVKFKNGHISGLGKGQTLTFNNVMYNAGGGYDPVTGFFTAPSSGTYAFFLKVMRMDGGGTVQLSIYKGASRLGTSYSCCSVNAVTTEAITVHLDQGEAVRVQIDVGSELEGSSYSAFTGMKISP